MVKVMDFIIRELEEVEKVIKLGEKFYEIKDKLEEIKSSGSYNSCKKNIKNILQEYNDEVINSQNYINLVNCEIYNKDNSMKWNAYTYVMSLVLKTCPYWTVHHPTI